MQTPLWVSRPRGGQRLEEHAQPGTGATDLVGSLAFLYLLRAAVQVPTLRRLNGFQRERSVVNVGVTYVLGPP